MIPGYPFGYDLTLLDHVEDPASREPVATYSPQTEYIIIKTHNKTAPLF